MIPANHLTVEEQNITGLGAKDLNYEYDADGKETRVYVTPAVQFNYDYSFAYDARGRFETITHAAFPSPYYQYYYDVASNELVRRNRANGVDQSYTPYDALNRMTRRDIIDSNGTNLNAEGYTYDPMSRITRVDRSANDDSVYTYYQDGELKSGTYVAPELNPVSYVWDKAGNRTSITDGGVNKTYSPNGINQYTAAEGAAVTNGNDHEITGYQGVTYDYLNDGQLNSATTANTTYTMAYDALGRCVKRVLNGTTTYYVYDGEKAILEYKGNGTLNGWNIYGKGIDEILMRGYLSGSTWVWYYYQQDHEGTVTHLTDGYGAIIERYKYDAFGQPVIYNTAGTVISSSAYNNRFMFTGREWAPANLGFYEYRARAYHPGLGRFMSEDPKGFDAGDYNLFRYCADDPIDKTDPMGLFGTPPERPIDYISPQDRMDLIHQAGETSVQGNAAASALSAAYQPIHIEKQGNWGNRSDPGYYQKGPLVGKDGRPNNNQGQTIADVKGYDKNSDGSVTAKVFIDVHVLAIHKGDTVDIREQEHVQGFIDAKLGETAFTATMGELGRYKSTSEVQNAKIAHFTKAFEAEKFRQRGWDTGGGRHDYSKFREWDLPLNPGSP